MPSNLVFQGKKSYGLKGHEAEVGTISKSPRPYMHVFFPSVFWQRPHISEHNCLRDVSSMLGFCRQALVMSQDLLAWFCLCSRGYVLYFICLKTPIDQHSNRSKVKLNAWLQCLGKREEGFCFISRSRHSQEVSIHVVILSLGGFQATAFYDFIFSCSQIVS